jgi:hypothetical protein
MTCCSIYDAALLDDASGSRNAGDGDGSGGMALGGAVDPGSGGGGEQASGGNGSGGHCPTDDCCPDDPEKETPGECGCGEPDLDSDGDLTADCNDLCPNEPTKTEPGDCGCGVSAPDEARCSALKNGIIHRYSFEGAGTEVNDSIGESHGTIENGGLMSDGVLTLDGIDQYVSFPAGMISSLTNTTFEAWFTWNGGADYQRIMDFGDSMGSPAQGHSYLYLAASKNSGGPGSGFSLAGNAAEVATDATNVLSAGTPYHIVLVVDEDGGAFNLYVNSAFQNGIAFTSSLANINDVNGYLGRSLFEADAYLNGVIDEFRIYDVALTSSQIAYSYAQGPESDIFE